MPKLIGATTSICFWIDRSSEASTKTCIFPFSPKIRQGGWHNRPFGGPFGERDRARGHQPKVAKSSTGWLAPLPRVSQGWLIPLFFNWSLHLCHFLRHHILASFFSMHFSILFLVLEPLGTPAWHLFPPPVSPHFSEHRIWIYFSKIPGSSFTLFLKRDPLGREGKRIPPTYQAQGCQLSPICFTGVSLFPFNMFDGVVSYFTSLFRARVS